MDSLSIGQQDNAENPVPHLGHKPPFANSAVLLQKFRYWLCDHSLDPFIQNHLAVRPAAYGLEILCGLHCQSPSGRLVVTRAAAKASSFCACTANPSQGNCSHVPFAATLTPFTLYHSPFTTHHSELPHAAFQAHAEQLLRFDGELHGKFLEDLFAEAVDDHGNSIFGGNSTLAGRFRKRCAGPGIRVLSSGNNTEEEL